MLEADLFLWLFFFGTVGLVLLSVEIGYRLGKAAHRRSEEEKESPVAAMAGTILGLVAFLLAFTFGIASSRLDLRKQLIRDEANAIETTFLRADFLQGPDRDEVRRLLGRYVDERLAVSEARTMQEVDAIVRRAGEIHDRLWRIAVEHGQRELNSDVAALYVDSLNQMFNLHQQRVAVGVQTRIPLGVWAALYALSVLGMLSMGYQSGVTGSKRSSASVILAISFALVTSLIAALDRPLASGFKLSQQPLIDVRARMTATPGALLPGTEE
jgi:hypothetical protein